MKRWYVVALAAGLVWMVGCGSEPSGGVEVIAPAADDGGDTADTAARTATAQKVYKRPVLPSMDSEPAPDMLMINNGAGIINPDFNEFMDLVPTYWHIEFGPVRIQESGGPDMSPAVMMGPGYTYSFISQDLVFDESPAGKTITLTAQTRCPEADKAKIMIRLSDTEKVYSDAHPGDDKWHELKVSTTVPQNFQGDTIGVVLTHSGTPKQPCWFDDVNLYVE